MRKLASAMKIKPGLSGVAWPRELMASPAERIASFDVCVEAET